MPTVAPELRPELRAAYWLAVSSAPPGCRLPFNLLAAVGQVESGSLAGQRIDDHNRVVPALVGAALDGNGSPSVRDTDAGQLDHDVAWDRAVGPMALVPTVWRAAGVDMDEDGTRDPQNIYDAAGAAMVHLCAHDRDLSTASGAQDAVLSYENSRPYLREVLAWKLAYDHSDLAFGQGTFSTFALATRFFPGGGDAGKPRDISAAVALPATITSTGSVPQPGSTPGTTHGPTTAVPTSPPSTRPATNHGPGEAPSPAPSDSHSSTGPSPTPDPSETGLGPSPDPMPSTQDPDPREPGPTPDPAPPSGSTPPSDPGPELPTAPDPSPTCTIPSPVETLEEDPGPTSMDGSVLCPVESPPPSLAPTP